MFKGKTYARILKELYGMQRHGIRPALAPTKRFLKILGDPHKRFRCFHVAGTNGKGSTTAMIAAALADAGYTTAAYYSPHVQDFRERFLINGEMVPRAEVLKTLRWMDARYTRALKSGGAPRYLTFFEWSTALAFCLFARAKVDVAVLETGMGGRFDATNAVTPEACVITNVSLEHTAVLGDSIAKIAAEKAGIIKRGRPVIFGGAGGAARSAVTAAAKKKAAPALFIASDFRITPRGLFTGAGRETLILSPSMAGKFQMHNAACAAQTLLAQKMFAVLPANIQHGIAAARLPGRFEVVKRGKRTIIFDVAHNPASMRELVKNLRAAGYARCDFLVGILDDKDHRAMLRIIKPLARKLWLIQADKKRGLPVEVLATTAKALGIPIATGSPVPAPGIPLCVTGSFTTVEAAK